MSKSDKFWDFVLKNLRYFLLTLLIMFYLGIIIYIAYSIGIKFDNMRQYYLLKKTGCNIFRLNFFIKNANSEEINWYYSYFNNLIMHPTINITIKQMQEIKMLASLRFISMYYMPTMYFIISLLLLVFIINIILFINYYIKRYKYIKYKWYYWDMVNNYNYFVPRNEWVDDNGD